MVADRAAGGTRRFRGDDGHVMTTFLATPDTWFDLPSQVAACAKAGVLLELTLTDGDRRPLFDVALDELQAIHHTFGNWWPVLGGDAQPASLRAGAYDRFLTESRGLLRQKAEVALANSSGPNLSAPVLVAFPQLDHDLLSDPPAALAFFRSFLGVPHSPSLLAWARAQSSVCAAGVRDAAYAWLRVVLQKVAVEDQLVEAISCLRAVYDDDAIRGELLTQEARALERCGLQHFQQWASTLGLDRSPRHELGVHVPRPRRSDAHIEPDVTVIVPSYCHEAFIEATLESVLAQTHSAFRLLVVDDCSSDRTVERASRVTDPRLQIVVNERNLGLGDTFLRAMESVTTPYVALLNSDDLFHPDRLERCTAVLRDSERIALVATGVAPIDASGFRLTPANVRRLFDGSNVADWVHWFYEARDVSLGADLLPELLERNFLVTSSNIVCRTDFLKNRREVLQGLEYCLDWQMFLDAAIDGALAYVPEELVGYRLHTSNTVWFADARRADYEVEVNRVLVSTLRRLVEPSSPRLAPRQLAAILDRLIPHAMKHSHANAMLLYAIELLGARVLEQSAKVSDSMRESLRLLSRANSTTAAAETGDEGLTVASTAARVIADIWREEAAVAQGSARWHRERLEAMNSSPEWLVGNAVWNRARLANVALPVARLMRWLRDRRDRSR